MFRDIGPCILDREKRYGFESRSSDKKSKFEILESGQEVI